MSYASRSLSLVAVAILVGTFAAGPAHAQASDQPAAEGSGLGQTRDLARSRLLAGYAGPGGDLGLQVTFTVPAFECGRSETSSLLTGVFARLTTGEGRSFVNGGGGVFLICTDGTPSARTALYDPTGKPADAGTVEVRDKIRVTYASSPSSAEASSTLENLTQDYVTVTGPFEYIRTTDFQVGDLALAFDGTAEGPVPTANRTRLKPVKVDLKKIKNDGTLTRYRLIGDDGTTRRGPSGIKRGGFWVKPA